MIFYVIFGDFVGWDWGTPAILQQKHPWKNWIKIWDWQTPPPSVGTKDQIFPMILFEGSPNRLGLKCRGQDIQIKNSYFSSIIPLPWAKFDSLTLCKLEAKEGVKVDHVSNTLIEVEYAVDLKEISKAQLEICRGREELLFNRENQSRSLSFVYLFSGLFPTVIASHIFEWIASPFAQSGLWSPPHSLAWERS